MKPEPRRGKTCAQCRKKMPAVTKAMRQYGGDQIDRDPFCTAACARAYHGVTMTSSSHTLEPPTRVAKYVNAREEIKRRRARIKREGLGPNHSRSSANYKNGCRCDGCREAYRAWQKSMRVRRREAA